MMIAGSSLHRHGLLHIQAKEKVYSKRFVSWMEGNAHQALIARQLQISSVLPTTETKIEFLLKW
jgi:hypothetical protein